jgi:hypothetical protein
MIDAVKVDLVYDEALIFLLGNRTPQALDALGKAFMGGQASSMAANDPSGCAYAPQDGFDEKC